MRYTITLEYQGKQYSFLDDFDYQGWDEQRNADYQVTYMYTEGNYSCDCNRGDFIAIYCEGEETFTEMGCGDTIKLISICEGERVVWREQEAALKALQMLMAAYDGSLPFPQFVERYMHENRSPYDFSVLAKFVVPLNDPRRNGDEREARGSVA